MMFSAKFREERTGLWFLLCTVLIVISTVTRILLLVKSFSDVDFTVLNALGIFFWGLAYDLINAIYATVPLMLYLWLIPEKVYQKKWHPYVLYTLFFIFSFLLLFNGVAEWFFWDEFNVRFNFIAVDYLVYTNEVVGNIRQSYPIGWIIAGLIALSALTVFIVRFRIKESAIRYVPFKTRSKYAGIYIVLFCVVLFTVTGKYHRFSDNSYVNELAGNGVYELFAAYRNNELDYEQFYKSVKNDQAFKLTRQVVKTPEAEFIGTDSFSIERKIVNAGPAKKLNVILISVESLSASFLGTFGNKEGITPFLDSLASQSLVFTNLYATGTRTVRGLEALSLCVPPTPGQSIVRRPDNEELFSLGKVFTENGYRCEYIYGGYSYFDNMGYFFGHNSYQVVDRSAISDDEIDYENIWGVADEDLFDLALREIGDSSKQHPVFAHIMTTSNHRPFTYPEGRIDIPSHTSRRGAVKYTDYAIGRFVKKASHEKWFNNTVFVIVADHCATSAGRTELPVHKYHIPLLIYSPQHVQPGEMNRLMSQIDIGPTVLGMLNFSYTSKFYGYDMFKLEPGRERAFISTYQSLGYMKDDKLVILSPQSKVESFRLSADQKPVAIQDPQLVNEAVAWYQSASYSFKHGLMR